MNDDGLTVLVDISLNIPGPVDESLFQRAVEQAVHAAAGDGHVGDWTDVEVGIRITGDEEMHDLNKRYREIDRPTDVLSFSFVADPTGPEIERPPDWPTQLGEIVLSYPYAERQAHDLGHSVQKELAWLTVHGTLQLLGYEHDKDAEAEHMEALEQVALAALGSL